MQDPKNRHLGTIAQVCRAISSQITHLSASGKNILSSNISSTRPHNMVNFGPLTAEIGSGVWGTPANFYGFRVMPADCSDVAHGRPTKPSCFNIQGFCPLTLLVPFGLGVSLSCFSVYCYFMIVHVLHTCSESLK